MPELFDGMTAREFLAHQKKVMGKGRPSKALQEKLNRARAVVALEEAKAARAKSDPKVVLDSVELQFDILRYSGQCMVKGEMVALTVSGSAGIGKTHTLHYEVFQPAAERGEIHYRKFSGYTRPIQLLKLLYEFRSDKSVILLDDNDAIFSDETALNILKAALDTHAERRISYLSSSPELSDDERDFVFNGRIAFITNIDIIAAIEKGGGAAEHLEAFRSRSHYLDLGLHAKRAKALWTARVVRKNDVVVKAKNVTKEQQEEIVKYIVDHFDTSTDISIRAAIHMGDYVRMASEVKGARSWQDIAKAFGY